MTTKAREALYSLLLLLAGIGFGLAVLVFAFSGCCHAPVCPPPYPVIVNKACPLPPAVDLPAATPLTKCGAGEFVCFDAANAKNIAVREMRMKQWIREVRAVCAPPSSQPASAPATNPTR